jgi:hypothetical protein
MRQRRRTVGALGHLRGVSEGNADVNTLRQTENELPSKMSLAQAKHDI